MNNYYVATTGNDITGDGSYGNPYATIQKGADMASAGDTVIVKSGTYTAISSPMVHITKSGSSGNYITFKSENRWGAKLKGANNTYLHCFNIQPGGHHLIFDGFEISEFHNNGVNINGNPSAISYITVRNCHIYNMGDNDSFSGGGLYLQNADNIIVEKNLMHDIGFTDINKEHALYINSASNISINYNIFYNIRCGWALHFYPNPSSNINIYNNTFDFGNAYSPGAYGSHIIFAADITNANVKNNIFNSCNNYAIYPDVVYFTFSNVVISNNMAYGGIGEMCSFSDAGITVSSNLTNTNPLLVDSPNDFHLQAGSPAINAGVNVGLTTDFDGNSIMGTPNMGVYEYLETITTTTTHVPVTITTSTTSTPVPTTTTTTTAPAYIWWNVQKSGTATRNNCPADYMGTTVTYTVLAGTYSSIISQADADAQAQADVNANKQTYANTYGTCIHIATYYNVRMSRKAVKNDCPAGYTGSTVTYTVPAGKYTSTISQADADAKAVADLNANTQLYANIKGRCRKRR